jgi:hypothetical protein
MEIGALVSYASSRVATVWVLLSTKFVLWETWWRWQTAVCYLALMLRTNGKIDKTLLAVLRVSFFFFRARGEGWNVLPLNKAWTLLKLLNLIPCLLSCSSSFLYQVYTTIQLSYSVMSFSLLVMLLSNLDLQEGGRSMPWKIEKWQVTIVIQLAANKLYIRGVQVF